METSFIIIENHTSGRPLTPAQQTLIIQHLPSAEKWARLYTRLACSQGVVIRELIGESNIGLTIAASRFNPNAGVTFATYAYDWCIKAIRLRLLGRSTPFDADIDTLSSDGLEYDVSDEESEHLREIASQVDAMLDVLNPQERKIIVRSFGLEGDPQTDQQIARQLKLSPQRVRQLKARALGKMRNASLNN